MDLVATCPKWFWKQWLEEGDCAGEPDTGTRYSWGTCHTLGRKIDPGDRLYIVAHGKLRGYSIVKEVRSYGYGTDMGHEIIRHGGAVAVTLQETVFGVTEPVTIPGFRGLRKRWWDRSQEVPFPDWRTP